MTNKQYLQKKARDRKNKTYALAGELVGLGNLNPNCEVTWSKELHVERADNVMPIYETNLRMAMATPKGRGERPHFKGKAIGRTGETYKVHAWLNEGGRLRIEILK